MGRLAGKVAYVLGAAGRGNMGQVIARRFAEEGATVAVGGRHAEELEWLAGELGGMAVTCDITKMEDIKSSVGAIMDAHGKLDIAVNATAWVCCPVRGNHRDELNLMMDLQFKGPYQWMQVLVGVMSDPLQSSRSPLRRRRFWWVITTLISAPRPA
ncbi:MAG: hypothetical protein CM15mP74_27170 [Halieaceae bacterium]|nr:MAG: hypothetical protein CM15mP74_27170 [Halieaceae bacterium]